MLKLDGEQVVDEPIPVSFQSKLATRLIARLQTLVIEKPGLLTLELQLKKKSLGSWDISVNKTGEEVLLRSAPVGGPNGPALSSAKKQGRSIRTKRSAKSTKR